MPATMAVLIPTRSPRELSSGPPELPGLIAASVWIIGTSMRPIVWRSRPMAETMPVVTVLERPKGLPIAITFWPTRTGPWVRGIGRTSGAASGSANSSSARSTSGFAPTTRTGSRSS
jgi:hypothetical protein